MGLYENMHSESVSRLALREPVVVKQDAKVRDAILAMREKHLGCAIVVDEQHKPLGMLAESDVTRLLCEKQNLVDEPIVDYMKQEWPWVKLTDPISVVLVALERSNVRFLIVVDEAGTLVGLTGQKGLMEYVAEHFPGEVVVQRIGCKPYPSEREGA